jgi:hypothetical protein
MIQPRSLRKFLFFLSTLLAAAVSSPAQYDPGQYTTEAPFRSWNSFPYIGAAALGRGNAVFAWGSDATVSAANPALLLTLPKWTLTLGGSFQYATAAKYGPVGSGVLQTAGAIGRGSIGPDHAAVSFRTGRFALSAAFFRTESYDRPIADASESAGSTLYYHVRYEETGSLWTTHFGAAVRLSDRIGLGLGLNIDTGSISEDFLEDIPAYGYRITGTKTSDLSGLSLNGGLFWEPSNSVRAALTFRMPSTLSAATRTLDRYQAGGGTDISIRGESEDGFHRPWILGAGLSWQIGERLRTALDVAYSRWSEYRATWIGENQPRDFRDVLRVGAGLEYVSDFRLFGKRASGPLRIGIGYDPQPAKEPRSAYLVFTLGTGLAVGGFRVDLGTSLGFESGSGDQLNARRISLACGYVF